MMNSEKEKEEKKGKQTTHFAKLRIPHNWSNNMRYKVWKEHIEAWCEYHESFGEEFRFNEVMESLRKNNSINGLAKYASGKVTEELRDKSKHTVENIMRALDEKYLRTKPERFQELVKEILDFKILGGEKAEDVWDKISKVRSMMDEEKMNANMD